jgi:alpha-N-acetylglucosaminidase
MFRCYLVLRLACHLFIAAITLGAATGNPAALTEAPSNRDISAATGLLARTLPRHADRFTTAFIPPDNGMDVFEVECSGDKIALRGNTAVSIASALNHYLKYTAHCDITSGCGDQLKLPSPLPLPTAKIRIVSPNTLRYAYNYCTHGYTMAWWDWAKWEKEIDYLAMTGINLALVIEGQEQVWINTLTQFGYTEAEVRAWLVMPTHLPWMLMSNMENYGGPVPASLVRRRLELGRKIIARMRELGIEPMLTAYCGMAPASFKQKFPKANVMGA